MLARDATFAELFSRGRAALSTAETLVEAMDRHGIDRAVAMGVGWNDIALAREANDYLMEAAAAYPGRLSGLCSVNPGWGKAALGRNGALRRGRPDRDWRIAPRHPGICP